MSDISKLKVDTTTYDIKDDKARGVVAEREVSPATAVHAIGSYIRYNDITYKVKAAIAIGDALVVDTNIEANDLPEGTNIFTPSVGSEKWIAANLDYSNSESGLTATNVQDAIDETVELVNEIDDKLDSSTVAVNGNPIVINEEDKKLVINTKLTFEPVQVGSGDPSPSNVRTINGYSSVELEVVSKNLVQGKLSGYNVSSTGVIGTSSEYDLHYAMVVKGTTYSITSNSMLYAFFEGVPANGSQSYDQSRVVRGDSYFTAPITGYVAFRSASGYANAQLELGSTITQYEPYNPITNISLSLPETVYGGTVDVNSGLLTVNKKIITYDGSEDESWVCASAYAYNLVSDIKRVANTEITSAICNRFTADTFSNIQNGADVKFAVSASGAIVFKNGSETSTLSGWRTWLASNNVTVCYELATPYTIKLTPAQVRLLAGQSVITSNGTTIHLTYSKSDVASIDAVDSVQESLNGLNEDTKRLNGFIVNNTDLNTVTRSGFYELGSGNTNFPTYATSARFEPSAMYVSGNASAISQVVVDKSNMVSQRIRVNGGWQEWITNPVYSDLCPAAFGGVRTIGFGESAAEFLLRPGKTSARRYTAILVICNQQSTFLGAYAIGVTQTTQTITRIDGVGGTGTATIARKTSPDDTNYVTVTLSATSVWSSGILIAPIWAIY